MEGKEAQESQHSAPYDSDDRSEVSSHKAEVVGNGTSGNKEPSETDGMYDFAEHVTIDFHEMFREPDTFKNNALGKKIGATVIHKGYYLMFTYVMAGVYYVFAVIIGALASLFWAIFFPINYLLIIWFVQPITKLFFSWLRIVGVILGATIRTVTDPCCLSMGLCLSRIKATMFLTASGAVSHPAEPVDHFSVSSIGNKAHSCSYVI